MATRKHSWPKRRFWNELWASFDLQSKHSNFPLELQQLPLHQQSSPKNAFCPADIISLSVLGAKLEIESPSSDSNRNTSGHWNGGLVHVWLMMMMINLHDSKVPPTLEGQSLVLATVSRLAVFRLAPLFFWASCSGRLGGLVSSRLLIAPLRLCLPFMVKDEIRGSGVNKRTKDGCLLSRQLVSVTAHFHPAPCQFTLI